jgi:hypothetical protein
MRKPQDSNLELEAKVKLRVHLQIWRAEEIVQEQMRYKVFLSHSLHDMLPVLEIFGLYTVQIIGHIVYRC